MGLMGYFMILDLAGLVNGLVELIEVFGFVIFYFLSVFNMKIS